VSLIAGVFILSRRRAAEACFAHAGKFMFNLIVTMVGDFQQAWSLVWASVPWTLVSIAGAASWGVLLAPRPADAPITSAEFERT
jgi:hypothetical protein